MKKGWLVVLLLALLLSFPSCKNRGETGDAPTATATSEQETPPTEEEKVKRRRLISCKQFSEDGIPHILMQFDLL